MDLDKFVAALKAHLMAREYRDALEEWRSDKVAFAVHEAGCMGSTLTGEYGDATYVDWDALNAEIDAFCAEFKKGA